MRIGVISQKLHPIAGKTQGNLFVELLDGVDFSAEWVVMASYVRKEQFCIEFDPKRSNGEPSIGQLA